VEGGDIDVEAKQFAFMAIHQERLSSHELRLQLEREGVRISAPQSLL
jgi:hypothetical protein